MSNEKKVRNPSQKEMDQLLKDKENIFTVRGTPVSSVPKEEIDEDITKPIDDFEPAPVKFRLPSGSTTVKKKYLTENNEILVRRFTSIEESMFKRFADNDFLLAIEEQIDSCIKTKVSLSDLSFIDKIPLYLFLIALTYGTEFQIEHSCDVCNKEFPMIVDLQKDVLDKLKYVPENFEYPRQVKLESLGGDITAHMHFQTVGESNLISDKGTILDQMLILIKKVTGVTRNDKEITPEQRENIIKFMDDKDRKKFRLWIDEFSKYGTDLTIRKRVCQNSACEMNKKEIDILLPLAQLMMTLIKRII